MPLKGLPVVESTTCRVILPVFVAAAAPTGDKVKTKTAITISTAVRTEQNLVFIAFATFLFYFFLFLPFFFSFDDLTMRKMRSAPSIGAATAGVTINGSI